MVLAATLRSPFVFLTQLSPTPKPNPNTTTTTSFRVPVLCGPRDNRGPLVKGRILSTEAIHAIQSLKRAHRLNPNNHSSLPSLSRLLKPDLLAALRELLRQDHCGLALHVLSTFRSEFPQCTPDLNLYADVASALARNQMYDEIDRLICDLEKDEGNVRWGEDRALVRLVKIVIGTGRSESTVKIYWMLKRSGCGVQWEGDEYVAKVLSKGLRRMGSADLADEVENEFCRVVGGNFGEMRRVMG
ncbi:hypothetical protein HS088_TW12G00362 [Tripterygium wilfordii]|uniref:Pentatricopeptide repeat-containing protein n=1 Tax=Tripterygium wilfordii TaxID=458696 RepID=A0A7J7CYI4_TRIWF|nr:protein THYLAKOID ASSEMBLY 8, chloroplastic [Tripterygium wilfordii]KAF5739162.1 hypothetical protein HS088_TW12G00362 [Tripterygium wilfordii]